MENEKLIVFLKKGSEIAGGAIGGAIGLIGGPLGSIAGGGLGVLSAQLINEVIERTLSQRQQIRIAATSTYIFDGIAKRIEAGEKIRSDNFFNKNNYDRSDAEELFEGTLLKCAEQYQEKKILYISHIFEETIFDESISPESANHFLMLSQTLSYRKLCIISYYGRKQSDFPDQIILKEPYAFYNHIQFTIDERLLMQDLYELTDLNILDKGQNITFNQNTHIAPDKLSLSLIGLKFYKIMNLNKISNEEILPIIENMKYKNEWGQSDRGTINGEKIIKTNF